MKFILMAGVRAYQVLVSPLLPATCRFQPSCSRYALAALDRFGAIRGSWLALRRLSRCIPSTPAAMTLSLKPSIFSAKPVWTRLSICQNPLTSSTNEVTAQRAEGWSGCWLRGQGAWA
jgi:putative membrane protein insertion efficiency factor